VKKPILYLDTVDDMIEHAKYPVFVHYAHPEPKPEYCTYGMYQMMQHAMDIWDNSTANKDLARTLTQLGNSPRITNIVCIGLGNLGRNERSMMQNLVASGLAGALKQICKAADGGISHSIPITSQDLGYTATDATLLSRLRDHICIIPDPEALLAINASSLVVSHAPGIPVKPIVADLAAESCVGPAALFWCRTPHDVVFPGVDMQTVLVVPESGEQYLADLKTRRVLRMLEGYEQLVAAKCVPGVHSCGLEDYAEEGNGEWVNWVGNMELWVRKE
jgi:hypothetical protein